ncbi:transketolase family protein [Actinotalea sp. JY-7885]|uniref:transketolase family protein n=1 Tax=Actinotalea sp. JY-7885 TaxID=2758576 RepID=UPI00165DAB31|nr:transketolase C-terminal domain-containing protein [Actinotalea sp. JY-7885]
MRARFTATMADLLARDPRTALVLADIGPVDLGRGTHAAERVINVGIREQALIGVAAGLATAGLRPFVHSYAPFLVERPYEQIKLDLSHQDLGAVLVSIGASYDAASEGRTHQCPADVALLAALPGWRVHVPGHPDEVEALLRAAARADDRQYVRLSSASNPEAYPADGTIRVVREGRGAAVLAVGPALGATLRAAEGLDVAVAYTATPSPLDAPGLAALVADRGRLVVVEPYLEGTAAPEVLAALGGRPIALDLVGVGRTEVRRYGSPEDHARHHGLDARGIRQRLVGAA